MCTFLKMKKKKYMRISREFCISEGTSESRLPMAAASSTHWSLAWIWMQACLSRRRRFRATGEQIVPSHFCVSCWSWLACWPTIAQLNSTNPDQFCSVITVLLQRWLSSESENQSLKSGPETRTHLQDHDTRVEPVPCVHVEKEWRCHCNVRKRGQECRSVQHCTYIWWSLTGPDIVFLAPHWCPPALCWTP